MCGCQCVLVGSQIRVICLPNIFYSFVLFPNIVLPFTPIPPVNTYIREREREGEGEEGGAEREVREVREREMFLCNLHALQPLIPKSLVV